MLLQQNDIVLKKVNWNNKSQSLQEIATELNINTDSLVFIDDSDFEINLIKESMPSISTFLVPQKSFNYPKELRKFLNIFFQLTKTDEDKQKVLMYQEQTKREHEKKSYSNIDDYLKNLKLSLISKTSIESEIPRLSQLTLKTNQFNTTTYRYSESELQKFYDAGDLLISFKLEDKYGDYGIIGFIMIRLNDDTAILDSFLMSCRAIGRQVEFAMFEVMLQLLKNKGLKVLKAPLIKNAKNIPVHNIYEDLGLKLSNRQNENTLIYETDLINYTFTNTHFVECK
jgi:FkbH-like protein